MEAALVSAFRTQFAPAASARPGFRRVTLLAPADERTAYRISLEFENEQLRQDWVASPEHVDAWGAVEAAVSAYRTALYEEL